MDLGLKGANALVTGASRGIGRAIAETLADEGANVAICARGQEGVDDALAVLSGKGVTAIGSAVDVADADAYRAWVESSIESLGGCDVLVANTSAGVGGGEKSWTKNLAIDIMPLVRGIEVAQPTLAESSRAAVVAVGTTAAVETFQGASSYNAMKAALIVHASNLAHALAPEGIRVNSVSPGPIFFENGPWDFMKQHMTELYDAALAQHPGGAMGTPEQVARAVVFLASPAAAHISGVNLVVDGAFTQRVDL